MISSISYNQQEIINNILELHVPSKQIDADFTYSKGVFYKNGIVPQPKFKFDLFPQTSDTVQSSSEKIPVKSDSFNCVVFDPLFVAGIGPSKSSIITNRFCGMKTMYDVWAYYDKSIKELYRVLKQDGVLIFKCMDTCSTGLNWFSHNKVMNLAVEAGFYPKDLFILLAKSRLSNWKTQKHGRKFHSYFWVFEKRESKVNYARN
jgi:hypothetical protein